MPWKVAWAGHGGGYEIAGSLHALRSNKKSAPISIRSDCRKEIDGKRRITPATKGTWLPERTKSFIVAKLIKIVLKAFPCKHVARELICQGADRTTSLQVTGAVVVSQDNLVKFDVRSRSKRLRS